MTPDVTPKETQILVGTDGSATAEAAVARAAEAARAAGARLHVVTVIDGPPRGSDPLPPELAWASTPGRQADEILRRSAAIAGDGVDVELHSRPGDPTDVLLDVADEVGADLIVVGNKGMHGVGGYVRPTVPNRISHRARCDVLIVATTGRAA